MSKVLAKVRGFLRDEDGATATEYAVLLALIAVVVIGGALVLGPKISDTFEQTAEKIPAVE